MTDSPRKLSRLKRSGDFRQVREAGASFVGRWLVFGVWKAQGEVETEMEAGEPKFGVVTSRKVGGAVVRNKVRRRIRHIHQAHLGSVQNGCWIVTVARFRAAEASFQELDREWCKLARRAGVLLS
jgi:ribonuclease P protein component